MTSNSINVPRMPVLEGELMRHFGFLALDSLAPHLVADHANTLVGELEGWSFAYFVVGQGDEVGSIKLEARMDLGDEVPVALLGPLADLLDSDIYRHLNPLPETPKRKSSETTHKIRIIGRSPSEIESTWVTISGHSARSALNLIRELRGSHPEVDFYLERETITVEKERLEG